MRVGSLRGLRSQLLLKLFLSLESLFQLLCLSFGLELGLGLGGLLESLDFSLGLGFFLGGHAGLIKGGEIVGEVGGVADDRSHLGGRELPLAGFALHPADLPTVIEGQAVILGFGDVALLHQVIDLGRVGGV